jgi:hypothetical protein
MQQQEISARQEDGKRWLTSFGWCSMGRVLSAVSVDDFVDTVVTSEWEVDLEDVVAGLHQRQDSLDFLTLLLDGDFFLHLGDERVLDNLTTAMEEVFDLDVEKNR